MKSTHQNAMYHRSLEARIAELNLPYSKVKHTAHCRLCGDLASANGLCIYCAKTVED